MVVGGALEVDGGVVGRWTWTVGVVGRWTWTVAGGGALDVDGGGGGALDVDGGGGGALDVDGGGGGALDVDGGGWWGAGRGRWRVVGRWTWTVAGGGALDVDGGGWGGGALDVDGGGGGALDVDGVPVGGGTEVGGWLGVVRAAAKRDVAALGLGALVRVAPRALVDLAAPDCVSAAISRDVVVPSVAVVGRGLGAGLAPGAHQGANLKSAMFARSLTSGHSIGPKPPGSGSPWSGTSARSMARTACWVLGESCVHTSRPSVSSTRSAHRVAPICAEFRVVTYFAAWSRDGKALKVR